MAPISQDASLTKNQGNVSLPLSNHDRSSSDVYQSESIATSAASPSSELDAALSSQDALLPSSYSEGPFEHLIEMERYHDPQTHQQMQRAFSASYPERGLSFDAKVKHPELSVLDESFLDESSVLQMPSIPSHYTRVRKRSHVRHASDQEESFPDPYASPSLDLLAEEEDAPVSSVPSSPGNSPGSPLLNNIPFFPSPDGSAKSLKTTVEDGLPVIQEFILDANLNVFLEGRRFSTWKYMLFILSCICSGGIVFLLCKWFVRFRCIMTTYQCPLAVATHIFVYNSYHQKELITIQATYFGELPAVVFSRTRLEENVLDDKSSSSSDKDSSSDNSYECPSYDEQGYNSLKLKRFTLPTFVKPDSLPTASFGAKMKGDMRRFERQGLMKDDVPCSSYTSELRAPDYLYSFEHRCVRFLFNPNTGRFFENVSWDTIACLRYAELQRSLSSKEVERRHLLYGGNAVLVQKKSIFRLIVDEILHPFNVFQLLSIILWSLDDYYLYAGAIFGMAAYSFVTTIYETKKNIDNMRAMAHHHTLVNVYRDALWKKIPSEELVPGDVFELSCHVSSVVCADCILLEGDCIVNESMLTGESIPVSKLCVDEDTWEGTLDKRCEIIDNEKYLLHAGTKMIRIRAPGREGKARAVVIRTGFNTTKGNLIRSMLFPKPTQFKFYQDSIKFVCVLAALAALGFVGTIYNFIRLKKSVDLIIKRSCDLITIVVPPALPATMAVGITFAMSRLKKKNIFCISPSRINICGKLNLFCFDKTGTLTEEGLDVLGALVAKPHNASPGNTSAFDALISSSQDLVKESECTSVQLMTLAMSTCHSLKKVNNELMGDPLEVKMFEFTQWSLEDADLLVGGSAVSILVKPPLTSVFSARDESYELGIIRCFDFVPLLRRQSVLVKTFQSPGVTAFVKGSPEGIFALCVPASLPSDYHERLDDYTHAGHRVIALATKSFPHCNWMKAQKLRREEVESDLVFLGFLIFENKLKSVSRGAIETLRQGRFRTVMCTGDNLLTAISVGKQCCFIKENVAVYVPKLDESELCVNTLAFRWEDVLHASKRLTSTLRPIKAEIRFGEEIFVEDDVKDFSIACTGDIFERLLTASLATGNTTYLDQVLMKCDIYARMSPDLKQRLVEQYQRLQYCVGFCGDGANDCGALKAADVGLSLSEAEASIAAPFTCKTPNILCVIDLVKEGRSSLVTSFTCFKFMALYSLIQFTTVSLLYIYGANLGDAQYVYIDLLVIVALALCIGRFRANEKMTARRPTANLMSKKVLMSIIGQIFLQFAFQLLVFVVLERQSWYEPVQIVIGEENEIESHLNTVLFSFSCFMYLVVAIIYSYNGPFQQPVYTNKSFVSVVSLLSVCSLVILMTPPSFIMSLMEIIDMPVLFRLFLLGLMVLYVLMVILCDLYFFPFCIRLFKKMKGKKKNFKYYKQLQCEYSEPKKLTA